MSPSSKSGTTKSELHPRGQTSLPAKRGARRTSALKSRAEEAEAPPSPSATSRASLSNAEIAHQLTALAQLLSAQGENPYKVRAYRRAAETIASLSESIDQLVHSGADLTTYPGIGNAISGAIGEIVRHGTLKKLESLRTEVSPELAALGEYPRLDPKRVLHAYRKLHIASVAELQAKLASGDVAAVLGARAAQHFRQALTASDAVLLYDADPIAANVRAFLLEHCGAQQAEIAGDVRRRVDVIHVITVLVATEDFAETLTRFTRFGGRSELVSQTSESASFRLPSGLLVELELATKAKWGLDLLLATGSESHLALLESQGPGPGGLARDRSRLATETTVYRRLGLSYIEPELREGLDEVQRARTRTSPGLVTVADIQGDLHAHSTSSDGAQSISQMAEAARARGYTFLGITDHSQSLKIAGGVSEADLRRQLRVIDQLNEKLKGFTILKSAEVDILADGSLDYPDELLAQLDYTICSIHSRFGLTAGAQTERILRAMDNPYFTILGHATGRLILRRPGYALDFERIIAHARDRGCYFEINSSPDRLDLSAEHARLARAAGVKIAICTDAHSTAELDFIRCGVDQARRAGLSREEILNCQPWTKLRGLLQR